MPGFGLIVALVLITLIGFLTANIIGRSIVSFGEHLLDRMPLVRNVYSGAEADFRDGAGATQPTLFTQVGLFEYPRKGVWSLVFVASAERQRDQRSAGQRGTAGPSRCSCRHAQRRPPASCFMWPENR